MNIKEILAVNNDNKNRLDELVDLYQKNLLIPFIGGGMSYPIYPLWGQLLKDLLDSNLKNETSNLLDKMISDGNYEDAAGYVYEKASAFFMNNIYNKFNASTIRNHEIKNKLLYLPHVFDGPVLTTNFDRCLEKTYEISCHPFTSVYNINNLKKTETITNRTLQSKVNNLIKLHGDFNDFDSIIFTKEQYDAAYSNDDFLYVLKEFVNSNHFLFLGCSLKGNDRYMRVIHENSKKGSFHYTFLEMPNDEDELSKMKELLALYGIYAVWYPNMKHDESIECLLNYLYNCKNGSDIKLNNFNTDSNIEKNCSKIAYTDGLLPYGHKDDIINSPDVELFKTKDNDIKVIYRKGEFILTLPGTFENHFVINHNCVCSKLTNTSPSIYDGKIFTVTIRNEVLDYWPFNLIGCHDHTYYYAVRVTDVRYDMENEEESKEYKMLHDRYIEILSSAESYSAKSNTINHIAELPANVFNGIIIPSDSTFINVKLNCYSTDYVLGGIEDNNIISYVGTGWIITAKKAVYSKGKTWFECWDKETELYYGWIRAENLKFNVTEQDKQFYKAIKEPFELVTLKAEWAWNGISNYESYNLHEDDITQNIAFVTSDDVTDFRIYSKDINGSLEFIYMHEELLRNQYLLVGLDFPGDFSAYTITYLDRNGSRMNYTISQSGKDGSICVY